MLLNKPYKLLLLFFITVILSFMINSEFFDRSNQVNVYISKSSKFSRNDISNAMAATEDYFNKVFNVDGDECKLLDLWYDEGDTDKENSLSTKNQYSILRDLDSKYIINLMSNFYVEKTGRDSSLENHFTYYNWHWTLIKYTAQSSWDIIGYGY